MKRTLHVCGSLVLLATALAAASRAPAPATTSPNRAQRIARLAAELHQDDPWPAIRQDRIQKLLGGAMTAAGVDAWIVFCRENQNDPLAKHVGGENAGRLTAFLFLQRPSGVEATVLAPPSEAITVAEVLRYARVVPIRDGQTAYQAVAEQVRAAQPKAIAVNRSELAIADGLTATEQDGLQAALGPELAKRLQSSYELVMRWLGVKLPAEIAIMRKAAELTDLLEYEAFDKVVPGKTTNGDMQRMMRARVEQLGFGHAWTDNPGITTGLVRGRGTDVRRVIIPGDIIDIDFGIKVYDTWCSDLQRFAYVLLPGETAPPPHIRYAWESASQSSRRMRAAMRPGLFGWEVDKVQIEWMAERGSLKHWASTGHSVGYWAHDAGPAIAGYQKDASPTGGGTRKLEPGMVFAFDGTFEWAATDAGAKGNRKITSEEMAVVTSTGAEYLSPTQNELVLISGRKK